MEQDKTAIREAYASLARGMYSDVARIILRNLNSATDKNPTYAKYTKEQIVTYLNNPANYEKQLRQMSVYMFNVSNY